MEGKGGTDNFEAKLFSKLQNRMEILHSWIIVNIHKISKMIAENVIGKILYSCFRTFSKNTNKK